MCDFSSAYKSGINCPIWRAGARQCLVNQHLPGRTDVICHRIVLAVATALFLLLLAGCAPQFVIPEAGEGQGVALLDEHHFVSADGTSLQLRAWMPERPVAIVIALHGFNDYSRFISAAAGYFADHHIALYAYDQRGFGNTPVRGRWPGRAAFTTDLRLAAALLHKRYPSLPIYLLGHSMGAAVVLQSAAAFSLPVDGLILAAPAVMGWSSMPLWQQWGLRIAAHTMPWKTFTGESLGVVASDNREMLIDLGRDLLVIKATRVDTIYGVVNLMQAGCEAVEQITLPTLILYGEHDQVIPEQVIVDAFADPLRRHPNLRLQRYRNGYHMLLRDLQAKVVWHDIIDWINDHAVQFDSEREGLSATLPR